MKSAYDATGPPQRGASVRKQLRKRATWHDSEWDIELERGVDDCFRGLVRVHADEERRTHLAQARSNRRICRPKLRAYVRERRDFSFQKVTLRPCGEVLWGTRRTAPRAKLRRRAGER